MAQTYKSYDFYGLSGSDNDEKPNKAATPSRLTQKQEKKKIDKAAKQESSDASSEEDEKPIVKGPPKDLESEYGSKNGKKVKQDDSANKKKSNDIKESSASKMTPDTKSQNSNVNVQKGEQMASGISQNTPVQTAPAENSSIQPMNIESQNIETSRVEDNVNNILSNSNNEPGYSGSNIPANVINQAPLISTSQTPSTQQAVTAQPNEDAIPAQPAKLQFREDREPASIQSKKKSGKYSETSSESSLSPQRSPKNTPKPVVAPVVAPAVASVEARQKSKLSSHLKSIRESMKAQEQEKLDPELNIVNTLPGDKPKFFVDITPIGIIQEEGETKKLVPQGTEMEIEVEERQYRILGQERAFRTGGKNLVEKLNKFFIDKEEEKKEEEVKEGEEDMKEVEEEFNFESRYFMYNPTKVCNRCKKAGHFERWCPEDVLIKCMFCVGHHRTDECTQVVCFQCYGVGHRARDCDAPGSLVCFRCGKRGHKSTNCGMIVLKESTLYREKKDGSGDIKCMKCGRYGHSKCNKDSGKKKQQQHERDSLYDEEREELNMKVLSRARDVQSYEFEGSISGESYEDLSNFAPSSKSKYEHKSRDRREKEIMREIKREKKDRKDREKHYKKKKSKRYY